MCSLEKEQIDYKNSLDFIDAFEVHLHGDERDDFSLIEEMKKPIISIHYPLKRCDIMEIAKEFRSEYAS